MTDEPEDIDTLMAIDPLELSKQDLGRIIAYQRKQRGLREAGVKPRKPKEAPAVSLTELLNSIPKPAKPAPPPAPKPSGGFRRF